MNFSNAVTPAPAPQQQVQKWEYLWVNIRNEGSNTYRTAEYGDDELAPYSFEGWSERAGDDGWELVTKTIYQYSNPIPGSSTRQAVVSYSYDFKRPKN